MVVLHEILLDMLILHEFYRPEEEMLGHLSSRRTNSCGKSPVKVTVVQQSLYLGSLYSCNISAGQGVL